jgi:hypothetical protein
MTTTQQGTRRDAPSDDAPGLHIHVAGRGVFVVMRGAREVFSGTFAQCYDYVNLALQGPREGLMC